MNITDLIKLAAEQGKVVVVNEAGEMQGVFLSAEAFSKLSGPISTKSAKSPMQQEQESAIERINKEILKAQLLEDAEPVLSPKIEMIPQATSTESSLSNLLAKRAEQLFNSKPFGRSEAPLYDMRSEVVDPTFGQPQVDIDTDEEIRPNFDDI